MKTNADAFKEKVAKMSDEELVILLTDGIDCDVCPCKKDCKNDLCENLFSNWLKKPEDVKFKDLKVGDKFKETTKKNDYIYIKTTGGYMFNIQTGEGCFYDKENKVYKVADIEVKEKE